jgi:hypothetical protein
LRRANVLVDVTRALTSPSSMTSRALSDSWPMRCGGIGLRRQAAGVRDDGSYAGSCFDREFHRWKIAWMLLSASPSTPIQSGGMKRMGAVTRHIFERRTAEEPTDGRRHAGFTPACIGPCSPSETQKTERRKGLKMSLIVPCAQRVAGVSDGIVASCASAAIANGR